jgi:hypothetical protein
MKSKNSPVKDEGILESDMDTISPFFAMSSDPAEEEGDDWSSDFFGTDGTEGSEEKDPLADAEDDDGLDIADEDDGSDNI